MYSSTLCEILGLLKMHPMCSVSPSLVNMLLLAVPLPYNLSYHVYASISPFSQEIVLIADTRD